MINGPTQAKDLIRVVSNRCPICAPERYPKQSLDNVVIERCLSRIGVPVELDDPNCRCSFPYSREKVAA